MRSDKVILTLALSTGLMALMVHPQDVQATDAVYTVGNYPIEAVALDAVAAKKRAHKIGRRAALRSLLKRLVPVAAYPRLRTVKPKNINDFVDGITVRSEQNSRTEYIASVDFAFRPRAVQALLQRHGIPFLDEQAQPIILVPLYRAPTSPPGGAPPAAEFAQNEGARGWHEIWSGLDLTHAVAPVILRRPRPEVHPDTITALLAGDSSAYRIIASEYNAQFVVLAVMEPDPAAKRLKVTLIGRDAVDYFSLKRSYRIQDDMLYTAELAAVIGMGVLEGRWKTVMAPTGVSGGADGGVLGPVTNDVRFVVTYSSPRRWRRIAKRIAGMVGVAQMEIAGQSSRGATVSLQYPGGTAELATQLRQYGLVLREVGGGWLLQGG